MLLETETKGSNISAITAIIQILVHVKDALGKMFLQPVKLQQRGAKPQIHLNSSVQISRACSITHTSTAKVES